MTQLYKTPKVLHIQECDSEGNIYAIRYYREDTVDAILDNLTRIISTVRTEADDPVIIK